MLAASNIDDKVVVLPMLMLMMDVAGVREEVGDMGSGGSENVGVGGIGMDGGGRRVESDPLSEDPARRVREGCLCSPRRAASHSCPP